MAAPTYSWTYLTDASLDPISTVAATTWRDMNRDAIHCREIVLDTAAHTPTIAHDHDGLNSALIAPPSGNLIYVCKWNDEMDESPADDNVSFGNDARETAGAQLISAGDYVAVYVGRSGKYGLFGAATKVVVSLFVRCIAPVSSGTLRFGLSDGSTTTYKTGCRAEIAASQITASWTRFWTVCTTTTAFTSNAYMLTRVQTTFDDDVRADCPAATLGTQLAWWNVCPIETAKNHVYDYKLRDVSRKIPIFDWRVTMRDAVYIAAV